MLGIEDRIAACPGSSVSKTLHLDKCWADDPSWGTCIRSVDPESIGLCADHLEEYRQ